MIEYEIIMPSASRPHLLRPALASLLVQAGQRPRRILVHDDPVFPERQGEVQEVVNDVCRGIPFELLTSARPISHGPTLGRLLARVETDYVLYSQDDLEVIRPLPIPDALQIMNTHALHQIRFNKRQTMQFKGRWEKQEVCFPVSGRMVPLCIADHWYFQTGLWRVARIKPVVDWWEHETTHLREHAEIKINRAMNGEIEGFSWWAQNHAYQLPADPTKCMAQDVRRDVQRTFIWGAVGEPAFLRNLGAQPEDWALYRPRGGAGPKRADAQAAEQ